MVTELHLSTYINTALAVTCFSLLIMGMSFKFGEISVTSAWADARSFGSSMATRAYTSSDCFAYETMAIHYDEFSDQVVSQRRVFPGIIDVRKFNQDRYFDCIQNYFFSDATEAPMFEVGDKAFAAFFIDFKIKDLDEPDKVRGIDMLSTREQLDITSREKIVTSVLDEIAAFANTMYWVAFGLDIFLGIAIPLATVGTLAPDISYAWVPADPTTLNFMFEELIDYVEQGADLYETTVPIVLRYVDDDGNIEVDHMGTLKTTIYYNIGGVGTETSASAA